MGRYYQAYPMIALLLLLTVLFTVGTASAGRLRLRESSIDLNTTRLVYEVSKQADPDNQPIPRSQLLALPPDATGAQVWVNGIAQEMQIQVVGKLRGLPAINLPLAGAYADRDLIEIFLRHDGNWNTVPDRIAGHSRGFHALLGGELGGLPARARYAANGNYVIITDSDYFGAAASLADWKRRKGFQVTLITTETTGHTTGEILDWLRDAYDSWDSPPEYLLILGDVDTVPGWSFSGNITDHPYSLMDEDDWLPDLIVGRLSVESIDDAMTVVAKTVAYERTPVMVEEGWFTRSLMVAGDYASSTPTTTIHWCGQQLETLGFEPAAEVFFPPYFGSGISVPLITEAIDSGVGIVAYRGWAYGPYGWEPPHFTTDDIPGLDNGAMSPIVMSFVCLNADFANSEPCFGEAWLRAGTATEPKGAVAFIGNSEHWSHTRYNDAMAISAFERIVDPEIMTIGQLNCAAKLRFIDYFPHELDFATHGEESVEFYFHTYHLLGDPELNFWRTTPAAMIVQHPTQLPAGGNTLEVNVWSADGVTPLTGARVGVVQNGIWLGCGFSDEAGLVRLLLPNLEIGADLNITVTAAGHLPHEGLIAVDDGEPFLAFESLVVSEVAGNGDGVPNPGEVLDLQVTIMNGGSMPATGVSGILSCDGPATVIVDQCGFPDLPAGASGSGDQSFQVQLGEGLEDGLRILFHLDVEHDPDGTSASRFPIDLSAPRLVASIGSISGDGYADPDEIIELVTGIENIGSANLPQTEALLIIDDPRAVVTDPQGSFPIIAAGATESNAGDPFTVDISHLLPQGTSLACRLILNDSAGGEHEVMFNLTLGSGGAGEPTGPDAYGYYAIDSQDTRYAEQCPEFDWEEISPLYGGSGTRLDSPEDNYILPLVTLPFPFTFYGESVNTMRVSDNGWISFDPDSVLDYFNWPIPSEHGHHSLVAPFWDNLNPVVDESIPGDETLKDGIYTHYDAAGGRFIVEWSRVRHMRPEILSYKTFQVVLHDPSVHETPSGDGEIVFYYLDIWDNDYLRNYSTVGIESPGEDDGLQYSYAAQLAPGASPPVPGMAILLTTETPVFDSDTGLSTTPAARILSLHGNVPNPFNPRTEIRFSLPSTGPVSLSIYSASGRRLSTLLDGPLTAGEHAVQWDGCDENSRSLPSGIYLCRLEAGGVRVTRKMTLLK